MKILSKALVLSAAVAVAAAVPLTSANADGWHHWHHHGNGDAWALGALGLATGAIIGGAIASDPGPGYYVEGPVYAAPPPPPPVVYRAYEPAPAYGGLRPWSGPWYRYCEASYRSFNPRTGTFVGYDGRSHFCVAR